MESGEGGYDVQGGTERKRRWPKAWSVVPEEAAKTPSVEYHCVVVVREGKSDGAAPQEEGRRPQPGRLLLVGLWGALALLSCIGKSSVACASIS